MSVVKQGNSFLTQQLSYKPITTFYQIGVSCSYSDYNDIIDSDAHARNRICGGMSDVSKFHELVEREIPRLRRYARALTRNADRADDLVQDTLLRAIAKAHLWQPGTDLRAWLFTVMHNQHVNVVRRNMREEGSVDIEQMSPSLVATTDPTGARQLRELEQALARLPDEQREVILLVGLEGMSYETVAEVLSVPIGTVRSRLSRGRDALRRLMGLPPRAEAEPVAKPVAA
jgi:RNA polymerase sigma-70 factor (ECF subfamily)